MGVSVCLPLPPTSHLQKQWDFALSNFVPDALYVLGDEADAPATNVFSRLNATYIDTAEALPDLPLVALAPEHGKYIAGTEPLSAFSHPDSAIYLFGGDHVFLSSDLLGKREPTSTVFIKTASKDDMFAHVAYAVTMWDRRMKRG